LASDTTAFSGTQLFIYIPL